VRWYLRFALSYRDVEELLADRGIDVDHATIYRLGPAVHATIGGGRPALPACRR
jgi:transposase-like protein